MLLERSCVTIPMETTQERQNTMLTANYHTHTFRCRHAAGTEREYIETAIAAGMKTLGFSDHCPQLFPGEYYSDFRMYPHEAEEYAAVLSALREEYKGRIAIKIGYEVEYYPDLFGNLLTLIRRFPCDYIILGQHFLDNETTRRYSGRKNEDESYLAAYVDQVCDAMRTGYFTCIAHPDLQNYTGPAEIYRREYSRLIRCAMETGTPLEINLLGIRGKRHYPNETFWALAGEMGADTVIGCDAHEACALADEASLAAAMELVSRYSLRLTEPILKGIS